MNKFKIKFLPINNLSQGISYIIGVLKYTINQQPDLIISRGVIASLFVALCGYKTILELHGPTQTWKEKFCLFIITKLNTLKGIILITNSLKNYFIKKKYFQNISEKILVLPDGIDLDRFTRVSKNKSYSKKTLLKPNNKFVIGYVGHLYEGRGIDLILSLAQSLPNIQFVLVGGNDKELSFYKNSIKIKNIDNVSLLGFIKNELLPTLFSLMDILLMPSQKIILDSGGNNIANWTSPMKMFEYMAAKKVIIASDIPVFREILNENNAVLCSPEDSDEWLTAITMLKNNERFRQKLANKAYDDVKNYTWCKRVEKILVTVKIG